MRIGNQNQTPLSSTENSTSTTPASGNDAAPTTSHVAGSTQASSLMPSFELRSLTAALQQIPSIRSEVVAETTRRLAAGQLQSPAALEATARAILGE